MSDRATFSVEDGDKDLSLQTADAESLPTEPTETINIVQLPSQKFLGDDIIRIQAVLANLEDTDKKRPRIHGFFGRNEGYAEIIKKIGTELQPEIYSFQGKNYYIYTTSQELEIIATAPLVHTDSRQHFIKPGDFILFEMNPKLESTPIHAVIELVVDIWNQKNGESQASIIDEP